jgi:predicted dehydrogenase
MRLDRVMTLRWGIAGPGRIARGIARDLLIVEDCELVAVGSRSRERAEAFVAEFAAPGSGARAYGSYRELLGDGDVDVVYISTPHRQHAAIARAALAAGKAILVEKAFTCTVAGAQSVVDAAHRHRRFAMEAMWTRFAPLVVRLRELLADGAVGEVLAVHADLGVVKDVDPADRLWDPAQGGGALLDLGVYPVSFAQLVLGTPDSVQVRGGVGPTGVEQDAALLLGYDDGPWSLVDCSLRMPLAGAAAVVGTAGRIDVLPRFHHPSDMVLTRLGADPERISAPLVGGGYWHELVEVRDCVAAGLTESPVMPLGDTLAVMGVLESALHSLGLALTEDESVEV